MTSTIKVDTISENTSANGVTIDGLTIKDGNIIGDVALAGTTPTFTIGDAGAEDAALIFDGNAQDFYIALDDSADDLVIGLGAAVGTTPIMSFDESKNVTIHDGTLKVESDNANALVAPLLQLDRISSSPADGDLIGAIRYTARLDSGSSAEFAGLEAKIIESSTADGEITLNIAKGGNVRSAIKANNTEVIINDASEDIDFRVESNNGTHRLFVDGGNNVVIVGGNDGSGTVPVPQNCAGGLDPVFQLQGANNADQFSMHISSGIASAGSPPRIIMSKSRDNTLNGNTILQEDDSIGAITFCPADGVDRNSISAEIIAKVDGSPGENDTPGRLSFLTTADGANTTTERVRIHNGGVMSASQGIALGVGTANTASNVLDDYEEGTWSIPNGAVNGITFAVASSLGVTYTKVGRNVTVFGQVVFGASTSDNNATYFGTLPFTSASNGVFVGKVQTTADITGACVELNGAENFLRLMKDSGGSYDYITRAESRNETFAFTITYHV